MRTQKTWALLALTGVLWLAVGPVRAEDDLLGSGDLGAGAELDPEVDAKVEALLAKARKQMDRQHYAEARALIEEADDLAPMDDRVLDLLDLVGQLESEEANAKKVLAKIEAEEAAKARARAGKGKGVRAILARHHLPRALPRATRILSRKVEAARGQMNTAKKARDRCVAAAALAHAAAGAQRCRKVEARLDEARKALRLLEEDLAALDEAYAHKKGEKALARLKKRQGRS